MSSILNLKKDNLPAKSFLGSLLIHLIIFFLLVFLFDLSHENISVPPGYIQINTIESEKSDETEVIKKIEENLETEEITEDKFIEEKKENINEGNVYFSVNDDADTSSLIKIYRENTLDVEVKYPNGWTYIDQNVKNKLDGVTFWSIKGDYNPPPYIHLEVKEKYLFNPSRFKYSEKMRNYTIYFNEPEELEEQISQVLYIRTDTDEDYSFKLIMKGEKNFKSFQPVFYGMVKTFKFNSSFF